MRDERMCIPRSEYDARVAAVQNVMDQRGIDVLVTHACGCESANVRWLTNFWAVFDFVAVIIPRAGKPILLTGGPESLDFAKEFGQIDDVRVHPMYVETSAPEWDKPTDPWDYKKIFDELRARMPIKKIGIANGNILPYPIMEDIKKGADGAEFADADEVMMQCRRYKSQNEIRLLREAFRITEEGFKKVVDFVEPGVREWEIEAVWTGEIFRLGAEGGGYPCWVTSGDTTYQSLCQSAEKPVEQNSMVQLSLGAKYQGYCGNMGRAVVLGKLPDKHLDMIKAVLDCTDEAVSLMGPGVPFAEIYDKFQARLAKHGFAGLNLYGPAHGTGMQECEGPWVDNRGALVMEPNMVFNTDVWIADDKYGVRMEDGFLVTDSGLEQLSTWRREIIYK